MPCSNCYNGCPDIVSDQCVRYTGVDVPAFGIKTGDSLSYVEQALITFLGATLDGSGVKITLDPTVYCDIVSKYLPDCEDVNALNLFQALVAATCEIQGEIDIIDAALATLNSNYDIDCLPGVFVNSDTHTIVQTVIHKLCQVDAALTALAIDIDTNYVKLADLNTLIQAYLNSLPSTDTAAGRMLPYTVVEYYGPLSNYPAVGDSFDITGAGQGYWQNIYLCNGQNGTPDKRGRVGVGVTYGSGMDAEVNPGGFNPSYSLYTKAGLNGITLTELQMPSHTHSNNFTISPDPHNHALPNVWNEGGNTHTASGGNTDEGPNVDPTGDTSLSIVGSIGFTGGGTAHANNQPAIACYYIMYIP